MYTYGLDYDDVSDALEDIFDSFFSGAGLSVLGVILLVIGIILLIVFVISLITYVLEAIPLYSIAKKMGRKNAWLAWIPVFGKYFRAYVLSDIAGNKELKLFGGKYIIKERLNSFWIYLAIGLLGNLAVSVVSGFMQIFPIVGQIAGLYTSFLYLIPSIATAIFNYAYLRDVLDIFKADKDSNKNTAIIITVLDSVLTFGLARAILLFTIMKKEPIPVYYEEQL